MSELLKDQQARERFRTEWQRNFAVSANAGSGKTTAISERLASMALSPDGAAVLPKTAVVTYTKKAAAQIGQRARQVLLRRLEEGGAADLSALDHLERAFFGTIHSFCLLLAQRYGQPHGLNLNPRLLVENEEDEDVFWEQFLEQDAMTFSSLSSTEVDAFLRFIELEKVFAIARKLNSSTAHQLAQRRPSGPLPKPSSSILNEILALPVKGAEKARLNQENNKRAAQIWLERFETGRGFLSLYEPEGSAKAINELASAWMAPLNAWLADAAAVLAAELARRYREYRFERGVQTYADQIDAAMTVLQDAEILDKIRVDGWRVVLDEAQDTDSLQFAVLVEITRPRGAQPGTWPEGGGMPPRAGHFCMVGDGQQAIYRSRADIRNFTRHLEAFARGDGGELLVFQVTFRAPHAVVGLLNKGFPTAFGREREYNLGLAPAEGAMAPLLQVVYEPLEAGPSNDEGRVELFPLSISDERPTTVNAWLTEEARQLARFLYAQGPASVGAKSWSEVCLLAPRVDWLTIFQREFEKAGLKTALQIRRNRCGDNPVYAWLTGLLAVICDPENDFEWFGILREVFSISDGLLAMELHEKRTFQWDAPEAHAEALRIPLTKVRSWILRVDDEGMPLGEFARGLAEDCELGAKVDALDASGAMREELERLLAGAAQLGVDGAGPREWLRVLLGELELQRAGGKPQEDAVNLLSCHSAKGLEWPVVIPVGFWRQIGEPPQKGLCLVSEGGPHGHTRVFLSQTNVPTDTMESRKRERIRELLRLLYVTLTRARRRLIVPWHVEFGSRRGNNPSFVSLWGAPELLQALPQVIHTAVAKAEVESVLSKIKHEETKLSVSVEIGSSSARLPQRLLPHQLAQRADQTRGCRHETALDQAASFRVASGDEAIDYGVWWHETMEFTPWHASEVETERYWVARITEAGARGFGERAAAELKRLQASSSWSEIRSDRWTLAPELAVFSPLDADAWIDGVMDLVLHDPVARKIWILDWKTNHCRHGESCAELLVRLAQEYAPQLAAYGRSLQRIMPDSDVRLLIYSSVAGDWIESAPSA